MGGGGGIENQPFQLVFVAVKSSITLTTIECSVFLRQRIAEMTKVSNLRTLNKDRLKID